MDTLKEDDFQPTDLLKQDAQWIDAILSALPAELMREVRVCRKNEAQHVEDQLLPFCQDLSRYLFTLYAHARQPSTPVPAMVNTFVQFDYLFDTIESIEKTKAWLLMLGIPETTHIILSYDFRRACLVSWAMFVEYCDVFCCQGFDDICISSVCKTWHLLYYHEDVFIFGKKDEQNLL